MYKFLREEFDLTGEEQEKAQFIIETVDKFGKEMSAGIKSYTESEKGAFDEFKTAFYVGLYHRLCFNDVRDILRGSWGLTDDGKKAYRVIVAKI